LDLHENITTRDESMDTELIITGWATAGIAYTQQAILSDTIHGLA